MARFARCPRCDSEVLSIIEVHEEIGQTDHARHEVDDGQIFPAGEFYFEPGSAVRVDMECGDCGHEWRSRRTVGYR